jgi:hypothetical protein
VEKHSPAKRHVYNDANGLQKVFHAIRVRNELDKLKHVLSLVASSDWVVSARSGDGVAAVDFAFENDAVLAEKPIILHSLLANGRNQVSIAKQHVFRYLGTLAHIDLPQIGCRARAGCS